MSFKINFHAHTHNSDGSDSILVMAEEAKRLGFSALVITDHDSTRKGAFQRNEAELKALKENKAIDFPVIIGCEILTPFGEFLLFGKKVIKNWMEHKEKLHSIFRDWDANAWLSFFRSYVLKKNTYQRCITSYPKSQYYSTKIVDKKPLSYAMIMCHPRANFHAVESYPLELWELVHGFEIQNGIVDYEITYREMVDLLRSYIPNAIELRNSDAHTVLELETVYNEVGKKIRDESQLIAWVTRFKCINPIQFKGVTDVE